jgi:hypothetical protein
MSKSGPFFGSIYWGSAAKWLPYLRGGIIPSQKTFIAPLCTAKSAKRRRGLKVPAFIITKEATTFIIPSFKAQK